MLTASVKSGLTVHQIFVDTHCTFHYKQLMSFIFLSLSAFGIWFAVVIGMKKRNRKVS